MSKNLWTNDELIVAFNLYCRIPSSKFVQTNPKIIEFARILNRTPGAVSMKLSNFARLDPELHKRGIKGLSAGSKADIKVWDEFHNDWNKLSFESERLIAQFKGVSIEKSTGIETIDIPTEGRERETIIMARVNQSFFRRTVLSSYDNKCCITGIEISDLLIASHIIPWKNNEKLRLNPQNGICLNRLHDKAFDAGYMTIDSNYRVKLSPVFKKIESKDWVQKFFLPYENKEIFLPQRFSPDKACLEYHYHEIFIKK